MLLEVLNYFLGDNSAFYVHVLLYYLFLPEKPEKSGQKLMTISGY